MLYDKNYYKLALGRVATARQLCSKVSQEYVRLLKYGDTAYRCKQLKRAALGRCVARGRRSGARGSPGRRASTPPATRVCLAR